MKIKEIKIADFGKFKDKSIRLNDGFNVIFGSNESGKTTLVSFIRFMLFGGQGRVNPVKDYFPLDLSEPSGEMVVSHLDTDYLIVRKGVRKKGSCATITNLHDGSVYTGEKAESLISEIVGVSEDMFTTTMYVKDISESTLLTKDELLGRLDNLSSSGDELVSYQKIISSLDEEKLSLTSAKRKDAAIPKIKRELEDCEEEIVRLKESISAKDNLEAELKAVQGEETAVSSEINGDSDEEEDGIFKLNERLISINNEIGEIERLIPDEYTSVDDEVIFRCENTEKALKGITKYIVAVLVVILGMVSVIWGIYIPVTLPLIIACGAYYFISLLLKKRDFDALCKRFSVNTSRELKEKAEFFRNKRIMLDALRKEREEISSHISELGKLNENKKIILKNNMEKAIEINTRKNRLITQLEAVSSLEKELREKEALYKEIKETLEKYSEYVKIIEDTKEIITIAYNKLKRDFSPVVSQKAGEVFSYVTNNEDENVIISSELNLSLKRGTAVYSLANLSRSTLDLIYFSFRMAIINTIIDNDGVIIFDEAFIRYDKDRLSRVISYLKESSHQIIFTSFSHLDKEIISEGKDYNLIQI